MEAINDKRKIDLLNAASQWDRCAESDEKMAIWNREHGFDLSHPGNSAGDHRAKTARRCARTLRAEAKTGLPHCMCHERPTRDCPNGGMGMKISY